MIQIKKLLTLLFILLSFVFNKFFSQNKTPVAAYPKSFTISKNDLQNLFTYNVNDAVRLETNKYLNNSVVLIKNYYGENKQLKLKTSYFKNAHLTVQINGKDSEILFLMSDDNAVFYKSTKEGEKYIMTKCEKDEIFSE